MSESQSPRRLPVDLSAIVEAATENAEEALGTDYERSAYLDKQTGAVHFVYSLAFQCANGEIDADELPNWISEEDVQIAGEVFIGRLGPEARFQEIEAWPSRVTYSLMGAFARNCANARCRAALESALSGRRPFRQFRDALKDWPRIREAWFRYEEQAHRERARAWLRELGIDADDTSPRPPSEE